MTECAVQQQQGGVVNDETPSAIMRRAASLMREQHRPEHVRHAFWAAVADWLDAAVRTAELTEAQGAWLHPESHAFKVTRAYLGTDPAGHPRPAAGE